MDNYRKALNAAGGWVSLSILCCAAFAQGPAADLKPGDPAPPLSIQEWLKGEPVPQFQKGHVYVIEFGSVNCGPCVAAVPHLTELSRQYAGRATVVGVHIWENSRLHPDDLKYIRRVRNYLSSMGDKIGFSVAVDVPRQATADSWMKAAGLSGVPAAFIVDQAGTIAWIGNPRDIDPVLEDVVAGNFDIQANLRARELKKQEAKKKRLKIGDPAPALMVSKWLKGEPRASFDNGQSYVVVICADRMEVNARKSIHRMTRLAREYAGQISMLWVYSEPESRADEAIRFVQEVGDKMAYPVALDTQHRAMLKNWLEPARQLGLAAFVVESSGKLAWMGMPQHLDPVLKGVVAGNAMQAGRLQEERQENKMKLLNEIATAIRDGSDRRAALERMDKLIAAYPDDPMLYSSKYNFLSQSGAEYEQQTNEWFRWVLDHMPPDYYYWEWFASDSVRLNTRPDYALSIEAADKAIQDAETIAQAAELIQLKAEMYAGSSPEKGGPAQAVQTIEQALRNPAMAKDRTLHARLKADWYDYRFQALAGQDDKRANALLREALGSQLDTLQWKWSLLVYHALRLQKQPDYSLLLRVADENLSVAAAGARDEPRYSASNARAICVKADVHAAKGDSEKAMAGYLQAIALSKTTAKAEIIEYFESVLAKFQEKQEKNAPAGS